MSFQLEYRRYRLAFRVPVRTAHGVWAEREGLLVRLTDEAGNSGIGEVAPIPWFGTESVDEAETCLRNLGRLIEADALDVVPERFGCVRCALRTAMWNMEDRGGGGGGAPLRGERPMSNIEHRTSNVRGGGGADGGQGGGGGGRKGVMEMWVRFARRRHCP